MPLDEDVLVLPNKDVSLLTSLRVSRKKNARNSVQVKRRPSRFETGTSVIPAVISLTSPTSSLGAPRLKSNAAGGIEGIPWVT